MAAVVFDAAFNLSDPAAQTSLLELCAALRVAECGEKGCVRPPHTLVEPRSVRCFLEDFAAAMGTPIPVGSAFEARLASWLRGAGRAHAKDVGWIDGQIKFVRIPFETTLLIRQPVDIVQPIYNRFRLFVDEFIAKSPPTLASCLPYGGRTFTWMVTETKLVDGVFLGFAICFPIAFAVLFLTTADLKISLFAILAIAFVVGTLLGFVKVVLGWELGTGECIAATIVLGLAVDYTVHLGHVISKSVQESRGGKVSEAASMMGGTVFAGSATTLGSALFMFMCQLSFFTKMAVLISGTVILSLSFALLFFLPLCALMGPAGLPSSWQCARQVVTATPSSAVQVRTAVPSSRSDPQNALSRRYDASTGPAVTAH